MTLFRAKDSRVEAYQVRPGELKRDLPAGLLGVPAPGADNWNYLGCKFWIETPRGRVDVRPFDWVVTDAAGERRVYSDSAFHLAFTPA